MNPFEWERLGPAHWLADATEPISHPLYAVLAVVLTLGLVLAIYARLRAEEISGGHRFKRRQVRRLANVGIALCTSGLAILLFRWQPVPFLSKRLWFYLWWLAAAAGLGYAAYYYRRLYPQRLAAYEESERRRRYLPRPAHGRGRERARARQRR